MIYRVIRYSNTIKNKTICVSRVSTLKLLKIEELYFDVICVFVIRLQVQRQSLSVQSLPAKLIKFDFPSEVLSHYIFYGFADCRLESVVIDLVQTHITCWHIIRKFQHWIMPIFFFFTFLETKTLITIIHFGRSLEKSRYVMFEYR